MNSEATVAPFAVAWPAADRNPLLWRGAAGVTDRAVLAALVQIAVVAGTVAGDLVRPQFSQRLTALLRPGDSAARLGGDEFTVLCEDLEPRQAELVAQRLRAAAAQPFTVCGHRVQLTAAVGISTSIGQPHTNDPAALLQRADQHMS